MADLAAIDRGVLDRLLDSFGGDLEFLGEMLDTFYEDSPRQLEAARTGLEAGDAEAVRRAAHSLKSNCANFGAVSLSVKCRELEMLAKTGSLDGGEELLAQISRGYTGAQVTLEGIRKGG